jgi:hypothetical protein
MTRDGDVDITLGSGSGSEGMYRRRRGELGWGICDGDRDGWVYAYHADTIPEDASFLYCWSSFREAASSPRISDMGHACSRMGTEPNGRTMWRSARVVVHVYKVC